MGLFLPLRIAAAAAATRPKGLTEASITYHLRSTFCGFAINVDILLPPENIFVKASRSLSASVSDIPEFITFAIIIPRNLIVNGFAKLFLNISLVLLISFDFFLFFFKSKFLFHFGCAPKTAARYIII